MNEADSPSVAEGVMQSAQSKGGDEALTALAREIAARFDSTEDIDESVELAAVLLEALRELCWTPRTRAESLSDEYAPFSDLGGASLRDWQGSASPDSRE